MAGSERRGLGRGSPAEWGQGLLLLLLWGSCSGRIHRLALTGEKRADIQLNSFGFYTNGSLEVELSLLRLGLLKGALLFITIALIGSGWAFVKYVQKVPEGRKPILQQRQKPDRNSSSRL